MGKKTGNWAKGKQGFQPTDHSSGKASPGALADEIRRAASADLTGSGQQGAGASDAVAASDLHSAWRGMKSRASNAVAGAKERLKPALLGNRRRKLAIAGAALASVSFLSACASDADVASENLSTAAEQFEIERRVVFFNGITDKYLLEINGRCSVETSESALGGSLEVTCKTGPNEYKKHYLGLSDNVSYFVEQVEGADVSVYNYRVVYKPDVIVPDIELNTQVGSTP